MSYRPAKPGDDLRVRADHPMATLDRDDPAAIREGLETLHGRWQAGELGDVRLAPEWHERLSRRTRVEETAASTPSGDTGALAPAAMPNPEPDPDELGANKGAKVLRTPHEHNEEGAFICPK